MIGCIKAISPCVNEERVGRESCSCTLFVSELGSMEAFFYS